MMETVLSKDTSDSHNPSNSGSYNPSNSVVFIFNRIAQIRCMCCNLQHAKLLTKDLQNLSTYKIS